MSRVQDVMLKWRVKWGDGSGLQPVWKMAEKISEFAPANGATLANWQAGRNEPVFWIGHLRDLAANDEAGEVQAWAKDMLDAIMGTPEPCADAAPVQPGQ